MNWASKVVCYDVQSLAARGWKHDIALVFCISLRNVINVFIIHHWSVIGCCYFSFLWWRVSWLPFLYCSCSDQEHGESAGHQTGHQWTAGSFVCIHLSTNVYILLPLTHTQSCPSFMNSCNLLWYFNIIRLCDYWGLKFLYIQHRTF